MACILIPPGVERRIRREARSATLRELALLRRREGWTLARIGVALGVSVTRVHQLIRKAERLEALPHDPGDPLGRNAAA